MGDIESVRRRAAMEASRRSRLNGVMRLLDALACESPLSPADHQLYLMAWQAAVVLRARPGDLAVGRAAPSVPLP